MLCHYQYRLCLWVTKKPKRKIGGCLSGGINIDFTEITTYSTALAAFAAFLTAIATIILAYFNKKTLKTVEAQVKTMRDQYNLIQEQAADTRKQAEIMEIQSNLMHQNMEYDRLLKQHERLIKEITLFLGPLFARRNDSSVFKLERRSQTILVFARGTIDQERYYYNTFWNDVDQNIYLNQSDILRNALNKYNATIDAYFEANQQNKPDDAKKLEDEFNNSIKPDFIRTISKRHSELDDKLKKIEKELKIRK